MLSRQILFISAFQLPCVQARICSEMGSLEKATDQDIYVDVLNNTITGQEDETVIELSLDQTLIDQNADEIPDPHEGSQAVDLSFAKAGPDGPEDEMWGRAWYLQNRFEQYKDAVKGERRDQSFVADTTWGDSTRESIMRKETPEELERLKIARGNPTDSESSSSPESSQQSSSQSSSDSSQQSSQEDEDTEVDDGDNNSLNIPRHYKEWTWQYMDVFDKYVREKAKRFEEFCMWTIRYLKSPPNNRDWWRKDRKFRDRWARKMKKYEFDPSTGVLHKYVKLRMENHGE